jgi:D-sedoheptulose 7-phosphate isomerase
VGDHQRVTDTRTDGPTSGLLERVRTRLDEGARVKRALADDPAVAAATADIVAAVISALRGDGRVLFFGNGGSATDAGHLAAELLGRFCLDRRSLAAIALPDATASMTAIGNDFGYDAVFARQVEGLARPGDVAVGLSTSGNSANVVAGLAKAVELGCVTVAFTGATGGRAAEIADIALRAPSTDTPRIQECHMLVGHTVCELVEAALA